MLSDFCFHVVKISVGNSVDCTRYETGRRLGISAGTWVVRLQLNLFEAPSRNRFVDDADVLHVLAQLNEFVRVVTHPDGLLLA